MQAAARPVLVTCGEPAGIGPDLAPHLAASDVPLVWLGDPAHLPPGCAYHEITAPGEPAPPGALAVLRHDFAAPRRPGQADPRHAPHVVAVIERAARLALEGEVAAVCTMPIHKKALQDGAGFGFPGHTEFLADLSGGAEVAMLLTSTAVTPPCRVVPATIHVPLRDVPRLFTPARLESAVRVTAAGLQRDFGLARPRIAVAGLNPHAGEGGAMGSEETDWMAGTLAGLRAEGYDLTGPLPADTLFHPAARARYDAAICCYHDQALIPIKTLDFSGGVNVTLGLPFIRTSPDHGTAFDVAGSGRADPGSALAALRLAHRMALTRGTA